MVKNLSAVQDTQVRSLGQEGPLEKGMASHSSILAWKFHGQRSLGGDSPQGCIESDTTEHVCTHTQTHLRKTVLTFAM